MKFVLVLFLFTIAACSSANKMTPFSQSNITSDQNTLFEGCSIIDTTLSEVWILLCKKSPHLFRPELYEYSPLFKTFKRLTFQDGLISDFVMTSVDDIIYSSTYDESKEQFLSIANGVKAGSDLYLKTRSQNDFTRLSQDQGSDQNLFWSKENQSLFFSHNNANSSQIRQLTKDKKTTTHVKSNSDELYSPITLDARTLYWLSLNKTTQKSTLFKKTLRVQNSSSLIFESATRLMMIRPSSQPNEILVTFSTGLGTELWSYRLTDACWKPILQTQSKWSRFSLFDTEYVYITENEQIKKVELNKKDTVCMPHPTGLGVEYKK